MKNQTGVTNPIMTVVVNSLVKLPTPASISYMWNWGSMLGITLMIQTITGILLASHFNSSIHNAFESVVSMKRNITMGYSVQFTHMNSASIFFVLIFIHISRGVLFSSFKLKKTWMTGTLIVLLLMGTAFMGYVLPWGQMSFWGATVITNLLSAIPYFGENIVKWLWGGFSIGAPTLSRFFTLHFIMPFMLMAMVISHLVFLHTTGSNKPNGMNPNKDKISFNPFFSTKDLVTILLLVAMSMGISFLSPYNLSDPENFNLANPLNTPIHIQPEWYFLFAYAILRSIPNKLGGVVALVSSIVMLLILPFNKKMKASKKMIPSGKPMFWLYASSFIILTWIGANPVEPPFENIGKLTSTAYFYFLVMN